MQCTKCKYEEKVPRWVLEELSEFDDVFGIKDDTRMQCPECGRDMYPKKD